jgi:hypothetical protein
MARRHLAAVAALMGASVGSLGAQEATDTSKHPPRLVEEGVFPKSIRIPGTDASFGIGGYAKVDFIQDFDAIGNRYEFKVNSIPAEGSADAAQSGQTTIHARETRINLDLRSGQEAKHLHAFIEGDFFGDNNAFRLRHAFGEYGHLLGGYTWTTFMDLSVRPLTLDFEGPEGEVFVRQGMLRWTQSVGARWKWAVAVENPNPQFGVPSGLTGAPRATMPDIPAFVRYETKQWHAQLAGIVRQLRYDGGSGESDVSTLGWGLSATARFKLFGHDALMGQVAVGEGAASYVDAFNGQKVDAVLTADGSGISAVGNFGGLVGYIRQWSPALRTGIAYSNARVATDDGITGTGIRQVQDVRVNTLWKPFKLVEYGVEGMWGRRVNQDGSEGDAWRVQASLIYHLN